MRGLLIGLVLAIGLGGGAMAQNRDIEATIGAQVEAFGVDDFTTAFAFASPSIQSIFGTPENFGAMVRQGYPMVWRPSDMRFLELRGDGDTRWQRVMFTDVAGNLHILEYEMIRLKDDWKINGVQRLGGAGANV